jgi:hypothetical protein
VARDADQKRSGARLGGGDALRSHEVDQRPVNALDALLRDDRVKLLEAVAQLDRQHAVECVAVRAVRVVGGLLCGLRLTLSAPELLTPAQSLGQRE